VSVRKAVILTAGLGTRMLPATKTVPKAALPIIDRPLIQYAVEEAAASGLDHVTIVTSPGQEAIEGYFESAPELERELEARGRRELLAEVRRPAELARTVFVRQREPRGIGDAVLAARDAIGREPFVLFFPDDVIVTAVPAARQLLDAFEAHRGAVLAVEEVARAEVSNYGIVDSEPIAEGTYRVRGVVEKPRPDQAPSNLAIVGRYVLTPEIFEVLERTPPGAGGELQITDALALLLRDQPIFARRFQGTRYDTGRPLGLLKASIEFGLARPDIGPELREYLRGLQLRN
jgi:UTP--glucose-1-phosphate uridylyltransferase